MLEQSIKHHEFMLLMQDCIDGELVLTADEIMDYADECNKSCRYGEVERLGIYVDYLDKRIRDVKKKGLNIAYN